MGSETEGEAENREMVTYCVGCSNLLGKLTPTRHLLDLFFEPEATLQGRVKPAGPPWTYWNRIKTEKGIKKTIPAPVTRERTFIRKVHNQDGNSPCGSV